MSGDEYLQLKHVSKCYLEGGRKRPVLQQVNSAFFQGEITAILGKSGSGKTTLLNLVSGIDRIDEGEIILDGVNLTHLSDRQFTLFRRKSIGFVFQFFNLLPTLTVWENIMLPLELNGLLDITSRHRAMDLLDEVGLGDRQKAFPDRLSGGEQQRVAIARALVHNPRLVLADEPTGNLDEETGRQIMQLLDRLTRRAGKNLLLVTHSSEAAGYADRVYELHNGKLVDRESAGV